MKKVFKILTYIVISGLLSSCFWGNDNDEINKAKEEMGIVNNSGPVDEINNINEGSGVGNNSKQEVVKEKNIVIENTTQDIFLSFDDISESDLLNKEVEISGTTLEQIDKIIVKFSNEISTFPNDTYTLQTFKAGDKQFKYRAFEKYETLDDGINEYIFEAYSGDNVAKTKITLSLNNEQKDNSQTNNEYIGDLDISSLPIGANFGEPRQIGNGKITYSDVQGLNIELLNSNSYTCEQNPETGDFYTTEILNKKLDSYFWWNTCRPLGDNQGISYYVLKLDGTSYVYEKHIYLNNGIYGIYNIEIGENFIEENEDYQSILSKLQEKNTELKEQNDTFTVVEVVNDLFSKILNNYE